MQDMLPNPWLFLFSPTFFGGPHSVGVPSNMVLGPRSLLEVLKGVLVIKFGAPTCKVYALVTEPARLPKVVVEMK